MNIQQLAVLKPAYGVDLEALERRISAHPGPAGDGHDNKVLLQKEVYFKNTACVCKNNPEFL